jgi:DNA mismatch repair protein MutS2
LKVTEEVLKAIEYPQVLERIAAECQTRSGRAFLSAFRPLSDPEILRTRLECTAELEKFSAVRGTAPAPETGEALPLMETALREGMTLTGLELSEVASALSGVSALKRYLALCGPTELRLKDWHHRLSDLPDLRERLDKTVSPRGEVLDTASPALLAARRRLRETHGEAQGFFQRLLQKRELDDVFQDRVVTERDGRFVVPVKREKQGRLPGLLHGLSSSGATVFLEPEEGVEVNNHLREARIFEEEEVRRVLQETTRAVLERFDVLRGSFRICAEVDAHGALAFFARQFDAAYLRPVEGAPLRLQGVRHPLLCLQEGAGFREKVVPLDLDFGKDVKVVLVSGPNAGGKTAALKTLGLSCALAQSGVPIPAGSLTTLPFLARLDSDLTDEQDLEKHMSTYAAKLTGLKRMMDLSIPGSLVLLDELGSGTDPQEGGALGLSCLEAMRDKGVFVMASTHQPGLKLFLEKAMGMVNAAMVFDESTGRPTYRLIQGIPGRSHALTLAEQIGFPREVMDRARALLPKGELDLSTLLEKTAQENLAAENARREAEEARLTARRLEAELREARKGLKEEAGRIRQEARQEALGVVKNARREVEHLIQGIGPGRPGPGGPSRIRDARKTLNEKLKNLEPAPHRQKADMKSLAQGDAVVVKSTGVRGQVEECDDGRFVAVVRLESGMRVSCDYEDLEPTESTAEYPSRVVIQGPANPDECKLEVDVRGCRADEALRVVDRFLDQALRAGLPFARIIHGKGTGRLREALHEYLKSHPAELRFRMGEWGEGDFGVTVVDLKGS